MAIWHPESIIQAGASPNSQSIKNRTGLITGPSRYELFFVPYRPERFSKISISIGQGGGLRRYGSAERRFGRGPRLGQLKLNFWKIPACRTSYIRGTGLFIIRGTGLFIIRGTGLFIIRGTGLFIIRGTGMSLCSKVLIYFGSYLLGPLIMVMSTNA